MNEATEAAHVLEEAADWLLVNGRCRNRAVDAEGRGCVFHALSSVGFGTSWGAYMAARDALDAHVCATHRNSVVGWNWDTEDDDEVRDTLLLVAKQLRGEAKP